MLTGTGPWDVTWSDSFTQTGVAASPATRNVSPATTTAYTVTSVSDASSCPAGTGTGSATVTVNEPVTPSVTVTANPGTTTCAGSQVIFTALPINGGVTPTFIWKTNGVQDTSVPNTSATYTNSNLVNGETIDCQLTTSLTCVTAATADAPQLTMIISTSVTPAVSVASDQGTTICAGTTVIFTATPVNGGGAPSYIWKTNGVHDTSVPGLSATYTNSSLANGDTLDCQLLSSDTCASPTTADATPIVMTVNATFTPSVTLVADLGSSICSNASVTFTATPVNGGATPAYQWKTNAVNVTGQTASTFATSNLKNLDAVTVVMTPSPEICVTSATATSEAVTMTVNPIPSSKITAAGGVVQDSPGNAATVPDAGAGATYVWTIANGTITAGQGTAALTYAAGNTIGTLTLGCTVTTAAGCSSLSSTNLRVHAPILAGWDVSTQPGGLNNYGLSPLSATTTDVNLAIGGLTRGSGVGTTGTAAARGWGGLGWNVTSASDAVTADKVATFTVTANAGFKTSFNAISRFDYRRSGTGATNGVIQYQVGGADTFHDLVTVAYPSGVSAGGSLDPIDLSGIPALQDVAASTVVTFRIVNFGGTSSAGSWYIFDVANSPAADFEIAGYVVACAAPTATLAGNATICEGASANLTTILTGTQPWSVTWSDGVTSNNITSSPLIRTVSPSSTTAYTVTSVTDAINCAAGTFSGSATVTVNQPVAPSVSVTANPGTTICAGSQVIFTALPVNGGVTPTYVWKTNGVADSSVPSLSATYTNSNLANGETIDCQLATSLTCVTAATADAPQLTMAISTSVTPAVTVASDHGTTICAGTTVIFTATPVNGGGAPSYIWKTNGVQDTSVASLSATYTNSSLANGATLDCQLLSSDTCATPVTANATPIVMTVNATFTPSVTIAADLGSSICSNASVTFTATPVNGGSAPAYQWKTNTVNVTGQTASTFTTSNLKNLDAVTVVMTPSSEICVTTATATSEAITMVVNALPTMTLEANPVVCAGAVSANLAYSAVTGSPDQYSIVFDTAAQTAGFADVALTALPASPIVITVPDAAATAVYNGTLLIKNSSGCTGSGLAFTVTVSGPPNSTITAPGGVCSLSTSNVASVPTAGTLAAGASYVWTISGGTITSADPQTNRITFDAGASEPIVLGCTVTSSAGCSATTAGTATVAVNSSTLTPYVMLGGNFSENFADIANWKNGFTCGQGANHWGLVAVNATGTIPDANKITVSTATFTSGSSQGVQRGAGTIVLLAINAADNTTASAIDLHLDFTGRNAGSLGFDWAEVNNSTGDRKASLRVYASTDGTTWTELAGAAVLNFQNNVAAAGSISAVALPSSFDNHANARIRFYIYNGTGGTTGSRPKIALDNVVVTSSCNAPTVSTPTTPSATVCAGTSVTLTEAASDGLSPFTYQWLKGGFPISGATNSTYTIPTPGTGDSGVYACEVASSCGATAVSSGLELTVNPLPSAPSTTGDIRCGPGAVNLSVTGSGGVLNWYSDAGLTTLVNSGPSYSPTLSSTATFFVSETSAGGCVSSATQVTATINLPPTVDLNSVTICAGGSTTLTATTSASNPGFLWSPGGATTDSITVSPALTTTYSVTVTDATTTCVNSASGTVTVNPLPTVTIAPATTNAECGGAVTFIAAPAGDGPLTYQWYDNLTNTIAGETNITLTVTNIHSAAAGNYAIVVTGPACSVAAVASLTLIDSTAPVITVNGANPATNECHVVYTDNGATAIDACTGLVSVVTNNPVNANVPGVYTVTYTSDDGNGNTNTATRTVYVVDTVAPTVTVLGANPFTNYAFVPFVDPGATATDACDDLVSLNTNGTVDVTTPGSYTLAYIGADASGNSTTNFRTIQVIALVSPTITNGQKLTDGAFEVTFAGPVGQPYTLLSSPDAALTISSWTVLAAGVFGESPTTYTDNSATNDPVRFYRISSP